MSNALKERKLNQLVSIVENGRYAEFTNVELANQLEVTRQTLDNLKKMVSTKLSDPNLEIIKVDLISTYYKLRKRLNKISDQIEDITDSELENGAEKPEYIQLELKVLKEIRDTVKDYVKLLEDFGIKSKVADKIDVTGEITNNINVNITTFDNERIKEVEAFEVIDYDRIKNHS